jgi:serine/threonine protein kinase
MLVSRRATHGRLAEPRHAPEPDDFLQRALPERYTIRSGLGRGPRGTSFRARDVERERDVVVTRLRPVVSNEHLASTLRRLRDQRDSLDAPALPAWHDPVELEGFAPEGRPPSTVVVRDWVEGETAASTLDASGPLDPEDVLEWLDQLCDVFETLHGSFPRIVHGNVTPWNLVRRPIGTIALLDGATLVRCAPTIDDAVAETIHFGYAPPELFEGEHRPATDLFQIGTAALHLLTGTHPIDLPRRAGTVDLEAVEGVPEPLAETLEGLIAADPDDRWSSIERLRAEMPEALELGASDDTSDLKARTREVPENEFQQMMEPDDEDAGHTSERDEQTVSENEFQQMMEPDEDDEDDDLDVRSQSIGEDEFQQMMEPDEDDEEDSDARRETVGEDAFQEMMEPDDSDDEEELEPRERQLSEDEVRERMERFEEKVEADDASDGQTIDDPRREAVRNQLEEELERAARSEEDDAEDELEARPLEVDEASRRIQYQLESELGEAAEREREREEEKQVDGPPPGSSAIEALDVDDGTDDEEMEARRRKYDLGPSEEAVEEVVADRYEVVRTIGEGDQSITKLAWDRKRFEHVAVKILDLARVSDWDAIEGLEREWQLLSTLSHSAVPEGFDYIEDELEDGTVERAMLVQEYVEGTDLGTMIERGARIGEGEVRKFLGAALEVLDYLHGLNPPVVHRNVKPDNLIRREDGGLALVDFGEVQDPEEQLDRGDATLEEGDPYVPVEQQIGRAEPASDIYALGVTMIHLLSHVDPMNLPRSEEGIQFEKILNLSDPMERYLRKMTAREAENRFQTAREAMRALKAPDRYLDDEDDDSFLDSLGDLAFWSD